MGRTGNRRVDIRQIILGCPLLYSRACQTDRSLKKGLQEYGVIWPLGQLLIFVSLRPLAAR